MSRRLPVESRTALTDREIAGCFNARIGRPHRVRLLGGSAEPLYLPARNGQPAVIRYTRDYPASALHEIAHWCIAGRARRAVTDYGYFYQPPPRPADAQRRFMDAELEVQALEMLFARASGLNFNVSLDDVLSPVGDREDFERRVRARARLLQQAGLSRDALRVLDALSTRRAACGLPAAHEPAGCRAG